MHGVAETIIGRRGSIILKERGEYEKARQDQSFKGGFEEKEPQKMFEKIGG